MRRRNYLIISLLLAIIATFGMLVLGVSEEKLLVFWSVFLGFYCIAILLFYFSSNCPWCDELFYLVNVFGSSKKSFPNLFSSKCLNCQNRGRNSLGSESE